MLYTSVVLTVLVQALPILAAQLEVLFCVLRYLVFDYGPLLWLICVKVGGSGVCVCCVVADGISVLDFAVVYQYCAAFFQNLNVLIAAERVQCGSRLNSTRFVPENGRI